MWHQYGADCTANEGLFLRIADLNITATNKTLTGSLAEAVGFDQDRKRIGEIKRQKQISEAVVAIPFFLDEFGEEKFFDIPITQFEEAYTKVKEGVVDNSISDMIVKMREYVNIPQYDFVKARDDSERTMLQKEDYRPAEAPFATYIFEFNHTLSRTDVKKIWQGVMPEIAVTAENKDVKMEHPIEDGELISPAGMREMGLNELPEEIRWKIFKIKKKAKSNYFDMRDEVYGIESESKQMHDFGYNWPYDYFSLVEMGKMEVGFEWKKEDKTNIQKALNLLSAEEGDE